MSGQSRRNKPGCRTKEEKWIDQLADPGERAERPAARVETTQRIYLFGQVSKPL